jgi:hypothetical protein
VPDEAQRLSDVTSRVASRGVVEPAVGEREAVGASWDDDEAL